MSNGGSRNPLSSLLRVSVVVLLIVVCVNLTLKLLVEVWRPLAILAVCVAIATTVLWLVVAWWQRNNRW